MPVKSNAIRYRQRLQPKPTLRRPVRLLRTARGVSQADLVPYVGIASTRLIRMRNNGRSPSASVLAFTSRLSGMK
jgi:transcriptional regulator with XRE-family HTH domain